MHGVHPTAIVDPAVTLGDGVTVGPYAVVEGPSVIGSGCRIDAHAVILRFVRMGSNCRVYPRAVLGGEPQHRDFKDDATWLEIGSDSVFREGATAHRATKADTPTRIGDRCLVMTNAHIAHDCQIGSDVVLVSGALLGGHVEVGGETMIGGATGIHQFVRIGRGAMTGAGSIVLRDVLPYGLVHGNPARHFGPNTVGLRRRGTATDRIDAIRAVFRELYEERSLPAEMSKLPELQDISEWLAAPSHRGIASHGSPR